VEINIISLNGNFYGLPTSVVRKVCDPIPVTPLPFSPEYVDGLVNIGGSIIVQSDLSMQLEGSKPLPADSGQIVVIESSGEIIALHVEQVLLMVNVDDSEIHNINIEELQPGLELSLLTGMFQWDDNPVLNLDAHQFGIKQLENRKSHNNAEGLVAQNEAESKTDSIEEEGRSLSSFLVVGSCNERYALAMENVCFVEDVGVITSLPQSPAEVVGMTSFHKAPLLVLGLGVMMGQQQHSGSKLVVVQYQGFRCALCVDYLYGIHRQESRDNHAIIEQDGELAGYFLGEDDRLIGVLNFDALFTTQRQASLRRYLVVDSLLATVKARVPTTRLLTFNVGGEFCALPLTLVNSVVEYQKVKLLPDGGGQHLHGAVQIHGNILPVVDLRLQMGVSSKITPLTSYIVAGGEGDRWALIVDQVDRVVEIAESNLEPSHSNEQQCVEAIGRINDELISVMSLESITMANIKESVG